MMLNTEGDKSLISFSRKVKKLGSEEQVEKTDFIPPWEQSIDATLCTIQ